MALHVVMVPDADRDGKQSASASATAPCVVPVYDPPAAPALRRTARPGCAALPRPTAALRAAVDGSRSSPVNAPPKCIGSRPSGASSQDPSNQDPSQDPSPMTSRPSSGAMLDGLLAAIDGTDCVSAQTSCGDTGCSERADGSPSAKRSQSLGHCTADSRRSASRSEDGSSCDGSNLDLPNMPGTPACHHGT